METTQNISIELIQTFLNTVKKNGVEGTLKILRKDMASVYIHDTKVFKIVKAVCDEFAINIDELVNEKYVRGDFKYAVGFCLYYLYKDYSTSDLQKIGLFKNKHKSVLFRYRQLVEKLDKKHKTDGHYLSIKEKLDIIIKKMTTE